MSITAQTVVERMQQKLASWKDSQVDTFLAGNKDAEVKGIVTTFAPSLEVMRKAVAAGKNMIVSRESPFWARAAGQARPGTGGANGAAGRGAAGGGAAGGGAAGGGGGRG